MRVVLLGSVPISQSVDCNLSLMASRGDAGLYIHDMPSLEQLLMALEELKTLHDAQTRVDAAMMGEVK